MKEYVLSNKKGLLLVLIAVLIMGVIEFQNSKNNKILNEKLKYQVVESNNMRVINAYDAKKAFLEENSQTIAFYAKAFRINLDTLKEHIFKDYDLFFKDSTMVDKALIDYLFTLEKSDKNLFNNTILSSFPDKEYMLNLIKYFTNIYQNVDFATAAAIARIESGYRAQYMIQNNNIFGAMANGKLIKYKTIEYGILKYIKLLSENYYGKGLTTISEIGRVYNPIINENGLKQANPNWVYNVTKVTEEYENFTSNPKVEDLLNFTL